MTAAFSDIDGVWRHGQQPLSEGGHKREDPCAAASALCRGLGVFCDSKGAYSYLRHWSLASAIAKRLDAAATKACSGHNGIHARDRVRPGLSIAIDPRWLEAFRGLFLEHGRGQSPDGRTPSIEGCPRPSGKAPDIADKTSGRIRVRPVMRMGSGA